MQLVRCELFETCTFSILATIIFTPRNHEFKIDNSSRQKMNLEWIIHGSVNKCHFCCIPSIETVHTTPCLILEPQLSRFGLTNSRGWWSQPGNGLDIFNKISKLLGLCIFGVILNICGALGVFITETLKKYILFSNSAPYN